MDYPKLHVKEPNPGHLIWVTGLEGAVLNPQQIVAEAARAEVAQEQVGAAVALEEEEGAVVRLGIRHHE